MLKTQKIAVRAVEQLRPQLRLISFVAEETVVRVSEQYDYWDRLGATHLVGAVCAFQFACGLTMS